MQCLLCKVMKKHGCDLWHFCFNHKTSCFRGIRAIGKTFLFVTTKLLELNLVSQLHQHKKSHWLGTEDDRFALYRSCCYRNSQHPEGHMPSSTLPVLTVTPGEQDGNKSQNKQTEKQHTSQGSWEFYLFWLVQYFSTMVQTEKCPMYQC